MFRLSESSPFRKIDALRLALVLWGVVGVAMSVRTLLRPSDHTVFPIFAGSSQRWWDDQPLYSLSFEHEEQEEAGPTHSASPDHFRYPPIFAIAFSPFEALGPRAGGVLWGLLGLGVYGLGLWLYHRDVLRSCLDEQELGIFLILALLGALRGLWNGQSNALAVGLLLLAGAFLARRRWWPAAVFLTASVALKLTPLAPALLLTALWRRQLVGRLLILLVLLAVLPFFTRAPETVLTQYELWLSHLGASSHERWPGFRDAYTVYQVVRECAAGGGRPFPFKEPLEGWGYKALQLLTAGLTLGWCCWQARRLEGREGEAWLVHLTVALGCGWLMLFGPSVEHATYAFLAPFQAWALVWHLRAGLWQREGLAWRAVLLASAACVLVLGWGALARPLAGVAPPVLAALPVGTGLFLLWLLANSRHPEAEPAPVILPFPAPASRQVFRRVGT